MASKSLIGLVVIATLILIANANTVAEQSLDVDSLLMPLGHGLIQTHHKVLYHGPDGKESCLLCEPSDQCGCNDIFGIRCENTRLAKKLHRMKALLDTPLPAEHPQ
jgi:hypothetical protein